MIRPLEEKYRPGNVTVSFEGGVVSEDLGKVLASLQKDNLLPTRQHVVGEGEDPCSVLKKMGYPPCSIDLTNLLDALNPELMPSKGKVKQGDTLVVPDVWLRTSRTARKFADSEKSEQTRAATIKQRWRWLGVSSARSGTNTETVWFDAYELILHSPNPAHQAKLVSGIMRLESRNVRIDTIPFQEEAATANSHVDPSAYQSECLARPPHPDKVRYAADYVQGDADAAVIVAQRPPDSTRARVIVVDLALDPTPNLAGAVDGQSIGIPPGGWVCSWIAPSSREHATHLASIIASQDNGTGFVGVSPKSIIHSFELIKPQPNSPTGLAIIPGREAQLADQIVDQAGNPYIYLVATSFSAYPDANAGQIMLDRRFTGRRLEQNIQLVRPLFVVAAGQERLQLSDTFYRSPQNLGDLHNVLVVTACTACTREDTRLWDQANYSSRFVHVAAPGGEKVLGWVSRSGVGAMNGTSQAAAFTAGILSEMIGRWPASYGSVEFAKKRIQVTSWPLYNGNGNNDYTRLATGIVDPNLALLDPTQHWIKTADGWQSVRLKGFTSTDELKFRTETDVSQYVPAKAIARIVQVSTNGGSPRYVVYSDAYHRDGALGAVIREGPLSTGSEVGVVKCDGVVIPLSDLTDLIIANRGIRPQSCGS